MGDSLEGVQNYETPATKEFKGDSLETKRTLAASDLG